MSAPAPGHTHYVFAHEAEPTTFRTPASALPPQEDVRALREPIAADTREWMASSPLIRGYHREQLELHLDEHNATPAVRETALGLFDDDSDLDWTECYDAALLLAGGEPA